MDCKLPQSPCTGTNPVLAFVDMRTVYSKAPGIAGQDTAIAPSERVAVGAAGVASGVTENAAEGSELPTAFTLRILRLFTCPSVRPFMAKVVFTPAVEIQVPEELISYSMLEMTELLADAS
jgi:hypothetical protein